MEIRRCEKPERVLNAKVLKCGVTSVIYGWRPMRPQLCSEGRGLAVMAPGKTPVHKILGSLYFTAASEIGGKELEFCLSSCLV